MTKFVITDIKWDTGGENIPLPVSVEFDVDDASLDDEEIEEQLSDMLSELTGFCHFGFSYELA